MLKVEVEPGVAIGVVEVGSGRPVVMLHGWGLDHSVWDAQVGALAAREMRVIRIDLRGHGRSDAPPAGYDTERLGADVLAVLDELGLDRVALVGWSLGGLTAFGLAARHPERVTRLVLVGSNGVANARKEGFPFGVPAEEIEDGLVAGELADSARFRRKVIAEAFAAPPEPELVERLLEVSLLAPAHVGAACLRTLLRTDQVRFAAGLPVPVTQIVGAGDPVLSRRGAAWLMEKLPEATQVVLEGCGHYPMFEAPELFGGALVAALSQ